MAEFLRELRDSKKNPVELFEEADTDKMNGVTPQELEQAFKKAFPKASALQIKKWVGHINYNGDKVIEKDEFINAIAAAYNQKSITGFTEEYKLKKSKELEAKQTG